MRFRPIGTCTFDRVVVSPLTHEWISLDVRPRLTGKRDRCGDGKAFDITVNLLLLRTFFLCGYEISERANDSFSAIRNSSFKIPKKDSLTIVVTAGNWTHSGKWILLLRLEDLAKTEPSCEVDCLDSNSSSLSIPVESESDWMGSLLSNCRCTFAEAPTARISAMIRL